MPRWYKCGTLILTDMFKCPKCSEESNHLYAYTKEYNTYYFDGKGNYTPKDSYVSEIEYECPKCSTLVAVGEEGAERLFNTSVKVYVLNTLMVPIALREGEEATVRFRRVSVEEAKEFLQKNADAVVSAIGHESTAQLLTSLLEFPISYSRISITAQSGDKCLHFKLLGRLPEGKVISREELEQIGFELYISSIARE